MSESIVLLTITAGSIGFLHTLMGPDHYLPFIVMSKSGQWSVKKTTIVTILCGIGHVLSSVILGFIGIYFGIALHNLEIFESVRGNIAAWLLMAFGLVYLIWSIRKVIRNKPHKHVHVHSDGTLHEHLHQHQDEHVHVHKQKKRSVTPWILFTIFLFGPCEPLIPLLMYPAAKNSIPGLVLVTSTFGVITIATMLSIVLLSIYGISKMQFQTLERYTHTIAGATIFLSGFAILFLGL